MSRAPLPDAWQRLLRALDDAPEVGWELQLQPLELRPVAVAPQGRSPLESASDWRRVEPKPADLVARAAPPDVIAALPHLMGHPRVFLAGASTATPVDRASLTLHVVPDPSGSARVELRVGGLLVGGDDLPPLVYDAGGKQLLVVALTPRQQHLLQLFGALDRALPAELLPPLIEQAPADLQIA